jgi:hypothetical protein
VAAVERSDCTASKLVGQLVGLLIVSLVNLLVFLFLRYIGFQRVNDHSCVSRAPCCFYLGSLSATLVLTALNGKMTVNCEADLKVLFLLQGRCVAPAWHLWGASTGGAEEPHPPSAAHLQ